MLGSLVYENVLNYLRKDKRGMVITIDEFNTLSHLVNKRVYASYCSRFEEDITNSSDLGIFKVVGYNINLTTGVGTLPTSYNRMIADPYYTDTSVTPNVVRRIDVVTSKEHSYRERDYLTKATVKHPTCMIGTQDAYGKMQIRVTPTSITPIKIDFLRNAVTPYLDYYVNDTTKNYTYMLVGKSVAISSGSTYRDGSTGTIPSLTVDWEFGEDNLPLIVAYFLDALGATVPDELLMQVGIKDKSEILSQ